MAPPRSPGQQPRPGLHLPGVQAVQCRISHAKCSQLLGSPAVDARAALEVPVPVPDAAGLATLHLRPPISLSAISLTTSRSSLISSSVSCGINLNGLIFITFERASSGQAQLPGLLSLPVATDARPRHDRVVFNMEGNPDAATASSLAVRAQPPDASSAIAESPDAHSAVTGSWSIAVIVVGVVAHAGGSAHETRQARLGEAPTSQETPDDQGITAQAPAAAR